jgi:hypothetical protein
MTSSARAKQSTRGRKETEEERKKQRKRREAGLQKRLERRQGAYEADRQMVDGSRRAGVDGQELQVQCGRNPWWTQAARRRCRGGLAGGAQPVDSSKERQASTSASIAKKQDRRRLFFLSSLCEAAAAHTRGKSPQAGDLLRATAYMWSIPSLFLLARTRG